MALDTTSYRKNVLARLLGEPELADPRAGDPFLVGGVDPDADDETAAKQFDEVVAFWNKERNHPRYRGVAAQLVGRKDEYAAVLLDPYERRRAAERVVGARRAAVAEGLGVLDELATRLESSRGGVPRSRVEPLKRIGVSHGLDEQTIDQWLTNRIILEDTGQNPWDASVRQQVRRSLDELAALTNDPPRFRTLYSMLDLPRDASVAAIGQAAERLTKLNQGARHDRRKTVLGDLLATVRTRLLAEDGPSRYVASLRADAYDLIRPEVEMLAVVTGELSPDDHQTLVAALVGKSWGLSTVDAKEVIRQVATDTGAAVTVAANVSDIIVCPVCDRPQAEGSGTDQTCRYCQSGLYLTCPNCATRQPAAATLCPRCGASLSAFRDVFASIAATRELPPDEAEARLTELLRQAPDIGVVQQALEKLPLAAPTEVVAEAGGDAVRLRWAPSVSRAENITYRLSRDVTARGHERSQGVGRTSEHSFEDAGAPSGLPLRYQIIAIAGERTSAPAISTEVLLARDVDSISARTVRAGGQPAVEFSYRAPAGAGEVVVERVSPPSEPPRILRGDSAGVVRDVDVKPGDRYEYRAMVEYRGTGDPIRTAGRSVDIVVDNLPVPVTESWFSPQSGGGLRIGFTAPPAGTVHLYASDGPDGAALATVGTDVDPALFGQRARHVGSGARRVLDQRAFGRVVYTPVTVVGDLGVVGEALTVIAAPAVTNLSATVAGSDVQVTFTMPAGVTEAAVRWRSDQFPLSADDPAATGTNITNTKLEIQGGLTIGLPPGDGPLYVAVYPTVRLVSSGRPVPASVATTLLVRR